MNPIEGTLRRVDRYQQRHGWVGFPFAVVQNFGDDKGDDLTTLLAWNGFSPCFPLLHSPGDHARVPARPPHRPGAAGAALHPGRVPNHRRPAPGQRCLLRANGIALVIGLASGRVPAASQAGQHAMAEIWNIPAGNASALPPGSSAGSCCCWCSGLGSWPPPRSPPCPAWAAPTLLFGLANLAARRQSTLACSWSPSGSSPHGKSPLGGYGMGAAVAGVLFTLLQALGGYLVGHNLKHAQAVYGFFAVVLGLMSWLFLSAQVMLYGAEVNVVRARRLWPRSVLQPPPAEADQRALVDLARQEERRPSKPHQRQFTPQANDPDPDGHPR